MHAITVPQAVPHLVNSGHCVKLDKSPHALESCKSSHALDSCKLSNALSALCMHTTPALTSNRCLTVARERCSSDGPLPAATCIVLWSLKLHKACLHLTPCSRQILLGQRYCSSMLMSFSTGAVGWSLCCCPCPQAGTHGHHVNAACDVTTKLHCNKDSTITLVLRLMLEHMQHKGHSQIMKDLIRLPRLIMLQVCQLVCAQRDGVLGIC